MRVGKEMQFFGARVNLAKALLYAINGGRDEMTGEQVAPAERPADRRVLDYEEVSGGLRPTLDWLAETYVDALNVIHYMHDKYAYERLEMALHDYPVHRFMAAASPGSRSRPTACRPSGTPRSRWSGTTPGWPSTSWSTASSRPSATTTTGPTPSRSAGGGVHGQGPAAPDLPRRRAHPVGADDHLERRLRQAHRQHPGRPPGRRAVRAGRQPDERPGPARRGRLRAVGRQAAVRAGPRRHLADQPRSPRRGWAGPGTSGSATWSACSTATSTPAAFT